MPFDCDHHPAVTKVNNNRSILIIQDKNCYILNVYRHYVEAKIERILWIAFYKNEKNDKCLIKNLPKDLVVNILKLLGKLEQMKPPCIKIDI